MPHQDGEIDCSPHLELRQVETRGSVYLMSKSRLAAATIKVSHGSDEVMGPLRIDLVDSEAGHLVPGGSSAVHHLEPGTTIFRGIAVNDTWESESPLTVRSVFRDSSGTWWHCFESEPVQTAADTVIDSISAGEQLASELRSKRA